MSFTELSLKSLYSVFFLMSVFLPLLTLSKNILNTFLELTESQENGWISI